MQSEADGLVVKPRDLRRSDEVTSIKLFFNNRDKQRGLPEKFWISKSYSQKNNFEGQYIYQTNLKGNAQVTLFVKSFRFEYVPAIKDKVYFKHLFEKLQTYLFEKEDKKRENKFSSSSKNFNEALRSETEDLFEKFRKSSGVDASFHIPSTLVDFFRTLSVRTENGISLFDRGDGVQARFIPEILDEISKETKRNIIWGFEEPENSYEAKNIRKIRDEFLHKYSKGKQVFITTHTKEFLSIKRKFTRREQRLKIDPKLNTKGKLESALRKIPLTLQSSDVSIYRVWKNRDDENTSFITRFNEGDNEWEKTCDDLGVIQEARIIETLQEKLDAQSKTLEESELSNEQQKKISVKLNRGILDAISARESAEKSIEEYLKPILYVEDKLDSIYKIAYLKIHGHAHTLDNYQVEFSAKCPFAIRRACGAGAVAGALKMNTTDGYEEKKVAGLFDYDEEGSRNFYFLRKGTDWDSAIHGDLTTGLYKMRNNHPCFFGLILPIPERLRRLVSDVRDGEFVSRVEIENLLSDEVLKTHNLSNEKSIMGNDYLEIKDNVKNRLPQVLVNLEEIEFSDYIPLFAAIERLFGIRAN